MVDISVMQDLPHYCPCVRITSTGRDRWFIKRQWLGRLMISLLQTWGSFSPNSRVSDDLRFIDVTVVQIIYLRPPPPPPWIQWIKCVTTIRGYICSNPRFWHMLYCTWALQWRHNGRDGLSNHQPYHCLLNRLFGPRSKKTSKLRVTGLCAENSTVTGEFPAQMTSNAENVPIWWRHHGSVITNHKGILLWKGMVGLEETTMVTQIMRWHLLVLWVMMSF